MTHLGGIHLQASKKLLELRPRARDAGQQTDQGAPLGVPGAVRSFVDRQSGGGMQQRAKVWRLDGDTADEHRQHGVALLGKGRGCSSTLGHGFRELAELGTAEKKDVRRDLAHDVRGAHHRVTTAGHRTPVGVPWPARGREAQLIRKQVCCAQGFPRHRGVDGREGADGATTLDGQGRSRRTDLEHGVGHCTKPARSLEPERDRQGGLAEGPPDHHCRAVLVGQPSQRVGGREEAAAQRAQRPARHKHERRVEHVLAGQTPVKCFRGV